ncbi:zinc finger protein 208-like [Huso huso]|uniref:Zinc finger protein 208-like n=1 Tax=Huso huso TaxID=61971 RepID=A0ABR0YB26_HUSHU
MSFFPFCLFVGHGLFFCMDCGEVFMQRAVYQAHRRTHARERRRDRVARYEGMLVPDAGGKTFSCAICGKRFYNSRGFHGHQRTHLLKQPKTGQEDSGEAGADKPHKCTVCGKGYISLGCLLSHQRSHEKPPKSIFNGLAQLKKKSFECPDCGRCYSRVSALDAHRRCHANVKLFKALDPIKQARACGKAHECPECGKACHSVAGLSCHRKVHSVNPVKREDMREESRRSLECLECGRSFASTVAVRAHRRVHALRSKSDGAVTPAGAEKPCACPVCQKRFCTPAFLDYHRRLAHADSKPPKSLLHQLDTLQKKSFKCPECGKRFSRASAFHSHLRCHTDYDSHQDVQEGSSSAAEEEEADKSVCFSPRSSPRTARRLPAAESLGESGQSGRGDSFECLDCSMCFARPSAFHAHRLWHSLAAVGGVTPAKLEVKPEAELEIELEEDPDLKPKSPDCGERFGLPVELRAHLLCHRRELKPDIKSEMEIEPDPEVEPKKNSFKCPECGQCFSCSKTLLTHRHWHTLGSMQSFIGGRPAQSEKPYQCDECGKGYCSIKAFRNHLRKHVDRKPLKSLSYQLTRLETNSFECPECRMCFSRASALQSHKQNHLESGFHSRTSSEKPFKCAECGRGYWSPGALAVHQKSQHAHAKPSLDRCQRREKSAADISSNTPNQSVASGKGNAKHWGLDRHGRLHPEPKPSGHSDVRQGANSQEKRPSKHHLTTLLHEGGLAPSEKPYRCDECGKGCGSIKAFHNHQRKHRKPLKSLSYQLARLERNSFECPECGMRFSRASALQSHKQSHLDSYSRSLKDKPYRCTECEKSYWSMRSLYTHKKCHIKEALKEEGGGETQAEEKPSHKKQASNSPYSCLLCCKTELEIKLEEEPDLKPKSPDCGKRFGRPTELHTHRLCHRRDGVAPFDLKPDIKSEMEIEPDPEVEMKNSFECPECGQCFSCSKALLTHQHWHTQGSMQSFIGGSLVQSEKPYQCDKCGKGYCSVKAFRNHLRKHVVRKPLKSLSYQLAGLEKNSFECPECGKRFSRASALQSHKQSHPDSHSRSSKDKPCRCTECEKSYWSFRSLYTHKKCHIKEALKEEGGGGTPAEEKPSHNYQVGEGSSQKPYPCPDCEKSYSSAGALHNHKKSSHKKPGNSVDSWVTAPRSRSRRPRRFTSKSYRCQDCGKRYSTQSALYNHKKSHVSLTVPGLQGAPLQNDVPSGRGAEPRKCQKCGKSFTTGSLLNTHRKQSWNSPYSCSLCCKGFPEEGELLRHMQRGHECRVCGMLFGALAELRLHLETHPGARPFRCLTCGLAFSHLKNLTRHQKNRGHQGVIREGKPTEAPKHHTCSQCGKTFRFLSEVKRHQPIHTGEKQRCQLYPKAYSLPQALRPHQQTLRRGDGTQQSSPLPEEEEEEPLLLGCIECGQKFSQELELHQHYIEHARGDF